MGKSNKGMKRRSGEREKKALAKLLATGPDESEVNDEDRRQFLEELGKEMGAYFTSTLGFSANGPGDEEIKSGTQMPSELEESSKDTKEAEAGDMPSTKQAPQSSPQHSRSATVSTNDTQKQSSESSNKPTLESSPETLAHYLQEKVRSSLKYNTETTISSAKVFIELPVPKEPFGEMLDILTDLAGRENLTVESAEKILAAYGPRIEPEKIEKIIKLIEKTRAHAPDLQAGQVALRILKKLMDSRAFFDATSKAKAKAKANNTNPPPKSKTPQYPRTRKSVVFEETEGGQFTATPFFTHEYPTPDGGLQVLPEDVPFKIVNPKFAFDPDGQVPAELLSKIDDTAAQADWQGTWPFLIQTIYQEAYCQKKQVLVWVDGGRLFWGTVDDDPESLIPELATMKLVFPKNHKHEGEIDFLCPGVCRLCLEEMDERDLEDFTPTLGFPPIKRPIGHSFKLSKMKKKTKSQNMNLQDVLELDEDAEDKTRTSMLKDTIANTTKTSQKTLNTEVKAKKENCAHSFKLISHKLGISGMDVNFNIETGEITPKSPLKTEEDIEAFSKVAMSFSKDIQRQQSKPVRDKNDHLGDAEPHWTKSKLGNNSNKKEKDLKEGVIIGESSKQLPTDTHRARMGSSSPKPRRHAGPEHYDQLRNQRVQLALGIGRFVIDSIKEGKKAFVDVSLDGRIELGHQGDSFPIQQAKKQDSRTKIKNHFRNHDAEVKLVTAPIVRICENKDTGHPNSKTTLEFPQAIAWHEMFKTVETKKPVDVKGKGKPDTYGSMDGNSSSGGICFGSTQYKIPPGQGKVYPDIEKLAENFVQGVDVAEEAWHWLMKKGRDTTIRDAILEESIAASTLSHGFEAGKQSKKDKFSSKKDKETAKKKEIPPDISDTLSYQTEETLRLLKQFPPGYKTEKLGFEKHLKEMEKCVKGMESNFDDIRGIIKSTLRDNPIPEPTFRTNVASEKKKRNTNTKGK